MDEVLPTNSAAARKYQIIALWKIFRVRLISMSAGER